jgi:plastocyanin
VRATKRTRRTATLAGVAVLALGVSACGGDEESSPAGATATIKTFMYEPDPLEVETGTKVTFTNEDDILHTVTEGTKAEPVKGGFDLQLDGAGSTGEVTFDEPGTIEYTCTIHDGMDGRVIVG